MKRRVFISEFYPEEDKQKFYENRIKSVIPALEERYGSFYVPELHDELVKQMVRHEMAIERYEQDIATDDVGPNTRKSLEDERKQYNKILDKLLVDLKKMIDTEPKRVEKSGDDGFKNIFNIPQR